jgi:hypothetical protein
LAVPVRSEVFDSTEFADAKTFRAAGIPAITISSQPQHYAADWNHSVQEVNSVEPRAYYDTYQTLCVLLIDFDRASRRESRVPSLLIPTPRLRETSRSPNLRERDQYGGRTLEPEVVVELHAMVCEMGHNSRLGITPFENLLRKKKLVCCLLPGTIPKSAIYWIAALLYETAACIADSHPVR